MSLTVLPKLSPDPCRESCGFSGLLVRNNVEGSSEGGPRDDEFSADRSEKLGETCD